MVNYIMENVHKIYLIEYIFRNNDPGLSGRNQGESVRERGGERDTIGITEIKRAVGDMINNKWC